VFSYDLTLDLPNLAGNIRPDDLVHYDRWPDGNTSTGWMRCILGIGHIRWYMQEYNLDTYKRVNYRIE